MKHGQHRRKTTLSKRVEEAWEFVQWLLAGAVYVFVTGMLLYLALALVLGLYAECVPDAAAVAP